MSVLTTAIKASTLPTPELRRMRITREEASTLLKETVDRGFISAEKAAHIKAGSRCNLNVDGGAGKVVVTWPAKQEATRPQSSPLVRWKWRVIAWLV